MSARFSLSHSPSLSGILYIHVSGGGGSRSRGRQLGERIETGNHTSDAELFRFGSGGGGGRQGAGGGAALLLLLDRRDDPVTPLVTSPLCNPCNPYNHCNLCDLIYLVFFRARAIVFVRAATRRGGKKKPTDTDTSAKDKGL
jgi:hypothetical protein